MDSFRPTQRLLLLVTISLLMTSGCAGTIIETATDTALAVAKVPFEAGGVIDGDEGD